MARLSRRKVVAALGSAPLFADGKVTVAAVADPVLVLCAHYGELARRQELLLRKWRATGRVFDRFDYLILLGTPHLDFGRWRLHQVEVLGCYCDHEGLCAQIDRAQRCGDLITLRGFATRIRRPDPTGKTHGVSLIVTSVHTHFANALRRVCLTRKPANAN